MFLHISIKISENVDINPLTTNVPHYIETSKFIWRANQLTGFYLIGNIDR